MERINFEGKEIFVGIDVHKKSWDIKIMTAHSSQNQIHKSSPSPEFLANYLKKIILVELINVFMKQDSAVFGFKKN